MQTELSPHWKLRIRSSVNMISDVYLCKPEAYASATKLYHIKPVSYAVFRFCEHSMYFHIYAILQCCLLCKILHALFNTGSPTWHKINVSCVCATVWWKSIFWGGGAVHHWFIPWCRIQIPLWLLENIKISLL